MPSSFKTVPPGHWQRAQQLRKRPSRAEQMLWRALRQEQLGVRFRRQHPIGPFITDFYCAERGLVIEVDGDTHAEPEQIQYDRDREAYLQARGLRVKRYVNRDVIRNLASVVCRCRHPKQPEQRNPDRNRIADGCFPDPPFVPP